MKKILLSTLIATLSFPMLSCAASFDCAKAGSATEKLICSDESISKLDEQLAASYKAALEKAVDKDAFKKTQVEWLKQQRTCKDTTCLTQAYQTRIAELTHTETAAVQSVANESSIASSQPNNSSSDNNKKTLTFTLTKGEGYPMCKQYVEMLNATKYPNKGALSCERKNLPNYPLFKSPKWTEITDKVQMEKIIKERITINLIRDLQREQIDARISKFMGYLKENKLKIYFFKDDFDKDGVTDTAYKFETFYQVPDESEHCNYQTIVYVDDSKTTIENAKVAPTPDAIRYEGFSSGGYSQLFYFGNTIFSSSVDHPNVNVWMLGFHTICEISIH